MFTGYEEIVAIDYSEHDDNITFLLFTFHLLGIAQEGGANLPAQAGSLHWAAIQLQSTRLYFAATVELTGSRVTHRDVRIVYGGECASRLSHPVLFFGYFFLHKKKVAYKKINLLTSRSQLPPPRSRSQYLW